MEPLSKTHDTMRRMNGRVQALMNNLKFHRDQTADNFQRVADSLDREAIQRDAAYDTLLTKIRINEADIRGLKREIMTIAVIAMAGWLIVASML